MKGATTDAIREHLLRNVVFYQDYPNWMKPAIRRNVKHALKGKNERSFAQIWGPYWDTYHSILSNHETEHSYT